MDRLRALVDEGLEFQRRGMIVEAIARYDAVLRADPTCVEATYYRAAAECQAGRLSSGMEYARRVLALDAGHGKAAALLGKAQHALGLREEALASFDLAVDKCPDLADAHANRAALLAEMGRLADALASFDRAVSLDPRSVAASAPEVLVARARLLLNLGRAAEAVADLDKIAGADPSVLLLRGTALGRLGRHADALAQFDRILLGQPDNVQAIVNRGTALGELGRHDEALRAFDVAIALKPGSAAAHLGRGSSLISLRRFSEALTALEQAGRLAATDTAALTEQGLALIELGRPQEAIARLDKALAIDPRCVAALTNRGFALADMRRHDQAVEHYRRAQAIDPDFPAAHWHEAEALLQSGDYANGWKKYEWRWRQKTDLVPRNFSEKMWRGEPLAPGTRVLLHAEQGLGDTIQFARYVPEVRRRGASVVLEVQGALKSLFEGMDGVTVVGRGETLPAFDLHCPLLSLPLVFNTTVASIPARVPYLSVPPSRAAQWKDAFPADGRPRIGVAWSGNPRFARDHHRSMPLAEFAPILDLPGASFIALNPFLTTDEQAVLATKPDVLRLTGRAGDFADTAAIIEHLDLVVTTDTSIAHLAGALGKPVWILLCQVADWRWLLDRSDSPWYPSARLFRQQSLGDWRSVVRQVREELARLSLA